MREPLDEFIYYATRGIGDAPPGAKLVPLTKGFFAVVDDGDFASVSAFSWFAHTKIGNRVYASRSVYSEESGAKSKPIKRALLHRTILGIDDPDTLVDHKNHIGLDCRRENLRPCSRAQNQWNRQKLPGREFKGIWKAGDRYQASISCNGEAFYLGSFRTETEAATAYDCAARRLHGEFAYLNFPDHQHLLSDAKNVGGISSSCL